MPLWFTLLCAASVIAYAVAGGVLLAFSDFLMRSFDRISDRGGIEAMQIINVEILRSVFMLLSGGVAIVSTVIVIAAALIADGAPRLLLILAGCLYLLGAVGLTVIGNVPLNNRLAALDPKSADARGFWKQTYMTRWVNLNSLRTAACMIASGSTLGALLMD